jgi:site-specific recombinase XerD
MPKLDKMVKERKHLVSGEVDKLLEATKGSRNEARDRCFLLLMFRHGLRVSEACSLRLSQVDLENRVLHVTCNDLQSSGYGPAIIAISDLNYLILSGASDRN